MFLERLMVDNPRLLEAAMQLHREGRILPDTYLLDLDQIEENARAMVATAKERDVTLFFMTKQIGRNPLVAKRLLDVGFSSAVVVDYRDALIMMEHDIPLGNVGHLVQVPEALLLRIMQYGARYMTIYSMDKFIKINAIAEKLGIVQSILLRITDKHDVIYPGQEAGITLEELPAFIRQVKALKHINIAGLTSFPIFLYHEAEKEIKPTPNLDTLYRAQEMLREEYPHLILNLPSGSATGTIPLVKAKGGAQAEPGHALTGTTPLHQYPGLVEKIAMVYVSEISHHFDGRSYCYGGGYYRRGHLKEALVSKVDGGYQRVEVPAQMISADNIDYHLPLTGLYPVGASVVMAFRTQIFVTRSEVAVVSGIHTGNIKLEGIYDSQGRYLRGE
ncbi:alanine racemase [Entomospira culicis]|uniref:YhfX family PLP-dependent enzyme n=1 Tax=Entomospira culicis TaxID=2719989 RepID=A0A968GIX4_9SPIO|nr:alanine racemase [Entomospira culicis]NIZ19585.1 YhfX family PLP-dependent enzyme [Entomospira culicis]NIZ69510.1 YhfX family PLP-dependent enzyme [Entomospira culicis]WDI36625.1 alanine racemase [Entomospira culicis]WDI38253.1 alanine racemase [Entomospira culicis]